MANMFGQPMALIADVGNSHDFPKGCARQRSDGEEPRGRLSGRINESAFIGGVQADAQGIDSGKPVVEQATQDRIARAMRDRIDTRAFHDVVGL